MQKNISIINQRRTILKKPKNQIITEIMKNKTLFFMILPAVVLVFIFAYIPMFGIVVAFKNYQYNLGILHSPWVGFKNFEYFFRSGLAWRLTQNTLIYNFTFLICRMFFQIFLAVLISELLGKRMKKMFQSMMLLPYFLSWVVVGGFVFNLFNYEYGVVNNILNTLGFESIDVYNNPGYWKYILTCTNIWKFAGYGTIFYLTAITGINPELYEAAYLDGASLLRRIYHITLPLLMPTAITLLLLSLGSILKQNFDMFYQLIGNSGQLFYATDIIDTYVFRSLLTIKDFGLTAATGLYQSVMGFILVVTVNLIVKRIESDNAIF